jgi:hypothetical protein
MPESIPYYALFNARISNYLIDGDGRHSLHPMDDVLGFGVTQNSSLIARTPIK